MNLPIPPVPTVFLKPATALSDPWPVSSKIPRITQEDNTGDYEAEMAIIIARDAKDVSEAEAGDYVLGYTAANDVSSRTAQGAQSQWCFSKGFDGSCPLGIFPSALDSMAKTMAVINWSDFFEQALFWSQHPQFRTLRLYI